MPHIDGRAKLLQRSFDNFDGEGVSPITRGTPPAGVTSTIITQARNSVRRNDSAGQGTSESVTADDATLVVATSGSGRIAGNFDRNTFFNRNGAGSEESGGEEYVRSGASILGGLDGGNVQDTRIPRPPLLYLYGST